MVEASEYFLPEGQWYDGTFYKIVSGPAGILIYCGHKHHRRHKASRPGDNCRIAVCKVN